MDHEWGGWPEDESELHGSLGGDADTADLTDSGAGLTELDGGHDYVDDAHDAFGGFDQPADDPAALGGHEPLPDDTFGDQHDESYDLGGHDSGAHDEGLRPFDESLQDEGPHEEALAQVAGAADGDHLVGSGHRSVWRVDRRVGAWASQDRVRWPVFSDRGSHRVLTA